MYDFKITTSLQQLAQGNGRRTTDDWQSGDTLVLSDAAHGIMGANHEPLPLKLSPNRIVSLRKKKLVLKV